MVKHTYTIEIDSSQRDPIKYPNSNDYSIKLNRPIYDVSELKLVSASIPKTQNLINYGNKQFDITTSTGTYTKVLTEGTWTNGADFASNIQIQLVNFDGPSLSNDIAVTYQSITNNFIFAGTCAFSFKFYSGSNGFSTSSAVGTPASAFGFAYVDTPQTNNLVSNVIDLSGATSFILSMASGATELNRFLYSKDTDESNVSVPSTYTGRITCGSTPISEYIDLYGNDKEIVHHFYSGNEKTIEQLNIKFFYNNGNKLIKYDFGNRNHILKFEVTCLLNKLETQESIDLSINDKIIELPPPVEFMEARPARFNFKQKTTILIIFLFLIIGLIALSMFNGKPRT